MAMEYLSTFYSEVDRSAIPEKRPMSQWQDDNRYGFICGILQYYPEHSQEVIDLFLSSKPRSKGTITDKVNEWFDLHIRPFKRYGRNRSSNDSSPQSQSPHSFVCGPRSSVGGSVSLQKEPSQSDLRSAVSARDGVCLFCWGHKSLQACHIIAQKRVVLAATTDIALLQAADLTHLHQVQNGLLLCAVCHDEFDKLQMYVDVVSGKMAVKLINRTNDANDPTHQLDLQDIASKRLFKKHAMFQNDDRRALEDDSEMALYFKDNEPSIRPSLKALELHKAASLIWRMAGGAEEDSDDEWDDGDGDGDGDDAG
ncbi:hypothetical protein HDV05_002565, partial [Chytridiales sp. JEL 0842]